MNSRSWGPGQTPGDGSTSDRGAAGEAAPILTGSVMPLISWASALLTILCVALAFVAGVANGLLVLATIFAAIFAWSVGAFTRSFWAN